MATLPDGTRVVFVVIRRAEKYDGWAISSPTIEGVRENRQDAEALARKLTNEPSALEPASSIYYRCYVQEWVVL